MDGSCEPPPRGPIPWGLVGMLGLMAAVELFVTRGIMEAFT